MGVLWISMREVSMDNGKKLFWRYSRGQSRGGVTTGRAGERASFSLHAYKPERVGSIRGDIFMENGCSALLYSSDCGDKLVGCRGRDLIKCQGSQLMRVAMKNLKLFFLSLSFRCPCTTMDTYEIPGTIDTCLLWRDGLTTWEKISVPSSSSFFHSPFALRSLLHV